MIASPIYPPTSSYTTSASIGLAGESQLPAATKPSKFLSRKLKNGTRKELSEYKVPQPGKSNGQDLNSEPLSPHAH